VTHLARHNIAYIELSVLAHATEDPDKVLEAAQNLLPPNRVDQVAFRRNTLKGEYGNPITFLRAQINDPEFAEALLEGISSNLSVLDRETLLSELEMRLKKGNFYLRLDKQAAFARKCKLGRTDPIHLRIKFRTSRIEAVREICQKIGMFP